MKGYAIRRLEPERDSESIVGIYNGYILGSTATFETTALTALEMRTRLEAIVAGYPAYVATDVDGNVTAYAYAHAWKGRAAYANTWETTVYVSPSHCGKGLGRRLTELVISESRQRGAHALIACITAENAASVAMHAALGFREVSYFAEVGIKFGRWLDVTDMELILQPSAESTDKIAQKQLAKPCQL